MQHLDLAVPNPTIGDFDTSRRGRYAGRFVVVDREPGQYLGHPTTMLLEDRRTMIAVYPKGHGAGAIVMKRSGDGGLTWGPRLDVPTSWATSREVPTIYRVVDRAGTRRLIMFSGLYPIRMAISEDDGTTWSELEPIGDFGGVVAMADLVETGAGSYMAVFHDDGRFLRGGEQTVKGSPAGPRGDFVVYKTLSDDGGLSWSEPVVIVSRSDADLCEPGIVVSPDGSAMAMLLRENSRKHNSFVMFSHDRGQSWSAPRELPAALTGDRHQACYSADGRLLVSFRDMAQDSSTYGDWVAWVGTWEDLEGRCEGAYRVRLMDNLPNADGWAGDCAYPALELLPDGTVVATTYGHWIAGEAPFILSVRFTLQELDEMARSVPP